MQRLTRSIMMNYRQEQILLEVLLIANPKSAPDRPPVSKLVRGKCIREVHMRRPSSDNVLVDVNDGDPDAEGYLFDVNVNGDGETDGISLERNGISNYYPEEQVKPILVRGSRKPLRVFQVKSRRI